MKNFAIGFVSAVVVLTNPFTRAFMQGFRDGVAEAQQKNEARCQF